MVASSANTLASVASISRMAPEVCGSLRLSGCEDERKSAIIESSVPCWLQVSGHGNPGCE